MMHNQAISDLEVVEFPEDVVMTLYNWRGHIVIQVGDGKFYLEVGNTIRKVAENFDDWKAFNGQPDVLSCISCGLDPVEDGRDACVPFISGARGTCCGHGLVEPYIRGDNERLQFPRECMPPRKLDLTLLQYAFSVLVPAGPFGTTTLKEANDLWAGRDLIGNDLASWISEKIDAWSQQWDQHKGIHGVMLGTHLAQRLRDNKSLIDETVFKELSGHMSRVLRPRYETINNG